MTLATHAIVGAALSRLLPGHPVLVVVAGISSHFLLDAIPHWDYSLASTVEHADDPLKNDFLVSRKSVLDLFKILLDVGFGLVISYWLFSYYDPAGLPLALLGAAAAVLPDFLQFVYFKLRWFAPLHALQRFHQWIHADFNLNDRPLLGVATQALLIILVIWFTMRL